MNERAYDVENIKRKLKEYQREHLRFNEPHFFYQLQLREGNKEEVIRNILDPDALRYVSQERGKYGDVIYALYFAVTETQTMKIPLIFKENEKLLYILTYIIRYRNWTNMIKREEP